MPHPPLGSRSGMSALQWLLCPAGRVQQCARAGCLLAPASANVHDMLAVGSCWCMHACMHRLPCMASSMHHAHDRQAAVCVQVTKEPGHARQQQSSSVP